MNHPPTTAPFDLDDYPSSSAISELDSLSDSDWLDVSSGHGSDDDVSVASDPPHSISLPASRRSSVSAGSSRDADIEGWEGFVDNIDSADEAPPVASEPLYGVTLGTNGSDIIVKAIDEAEVDPVDPVEDERVRQALDQSMVGTLSLSRSSSGGNTAQISTRDLRLSFPDPLNNTHSHNELNGSYDTVLPSDAAVSHIIDNPISPTPPVHRDDKVTPAPNKVPQQEQTQDPQFEVVLYGADSDMKWSFVEDLIRIGFVSRKGSVRTTVKTVDERTKYIQVERPINNFASLIDIVVVYDRTQEVIRPNLVCLHFCYSDQSFIILSPSTALGVNQWFTATLIGNRIPTFFPWRLAYSYLVPSCGRAFFPFFFL